MEKALQWRTLFDSAWRTVLSVAEIEVDEVVSIPPLGTSQELLPAQTRNWTPGLLPTRSFAEGGYRRPLSDHVGQLNAECVNAVRPMNARGIRLWEPEHSAVTRSFVTSNQWLGTLIRAYERTYSGLYSNRMGRSCGRLSSGISHFSDSTVERGNV